MTDLLYMMTIHTHVIVYSGREKRTKVGPCKGGTRYSNYLDDYWLCAGGLSAVNAIGTQLRDLINSRWYLMLYAAAVAEAGGIS